MLCGMFPSTIPLLFLGVFLTYAHSSYPGPLPLGPLITRLVVRLGVSVTSFRTENPTFLMLTDQVLDECEIEIGGGGGVQMMKTVMTAQVMTVSTNDNDNDAPLLAATVAGLLVDYGSDEDSNEV
ncbi:unnamed protein product [Linum trigynum]|uniref:Uncharacterized protein n=1 Tax=Linum trigynum TaxID=586398 RepID=A0AAV2DER5_9ROSI